MIKGVTKLVTPQDPFYLTVLDKGYSLIKIFLNNNKIGTPFLKNEQIVKQFLINYSIFFYLLFKK